MHLAPGASITDRERVETPVSTRWHRAHGRQTRGERAVKQQLLTPQEEKALESVTQARRDAVMVTANVKD